MRQAGFRLSIDHVLPITIAGANSLLRHRFFQSGLNWMEIYGAITAAGTTVQNERLPLGVYAAGRLVQWIGPRGVPTTGAAGVLLVAMMFVVHHSTTRRSNDRRSGGKA